MNLLQFGHELLISSNFGRIVESTLLKLVWSSSSERFLRIMSQLRSAGKITLIRSNFPLGKEILSG